MKHSKEKILEVGMHLFWDHGYHATGVNEVLSAAGIPKGSFYHYFSSKTDFVLQVLEYYTELTYEKSFAPILTQEGLSPVDKISDFYTGLIQSQQENGLRGCLWLRLSQELAGFDTEIDRCLQAALSRRLSLLTAVIKEAQDASSITGRFEADQIASFLHGSFLGSLNMARMTHSLEPLEDFRSALVGGLLFERVV